MDADPTDWKPQPNVSPPWHLQAIVVLFLAALAGLGLRTIVLDDARFGWGMFSKQLDHRTKYYWVLDDGTRVATPLGRELAYPASKINDRWRHISRYSLGAVRTWVDGYLRYQFEHHRPADAQAIEAEVRYQVNRTGPVRTLALRYPRHTVSTND